MGATQTPSDWQLAEWRRERDALCQTLLANPTDPERREATLRLRVLAFLMKRYDPDAPPAPFADLGVSPLRQAEAPVEPAEDRHSHPDPPVRPPRSVRLAHTGDDARPAPPLNDMPQTWEFHRPGEPPGSGKPIALEFIDDKEFFELVAQMELDGNAELLPEASSGPVEPSPPSEPSPLAFATESPDSRDRRMLRLMQGRGVPIDVAVLQFICANGYAPPGWRYAAKTREIQSEDGARSIGPNHLPQFREETVTEASPDASWVYSVFVAVRQTLVRLRQRILWYRAVRSLRRHSRKGAASSG